MNQKIMYDLLFRSVSETIEKLANDPEHLGATVGVIGILHTWGQNLSLHPHIHCLIPAAGYSINGCWKNIGPSGNYLYPVHQLSNAFKGKFLDSLKRALRKQGEMHLFDQKLSQAYKTRWVAHCEPALTSAEHVIRYLGQYTHRVAITNKRILNIAGGKVTFIAKDYRDRALNKSVTLDGVEFLRRFSMHILPARFVKIRRFGIYNHTTKRSLKLQFCPQQKPTIDTLKKRKDPKETNLERFRRLTGFDPCQCPVCNKGRMIAVRELPPIRAPVADTALMFYPFPVR